MEHLQNQTSVTTSQEAIKSAGKSDREKAWAIMEPFYARAKKMRDPLEYNDEAEEPTWTTEEAHSFMCSASFYRMGISLQRDDDNRAVYRLLCYYFSGNEGEFLEQANTLGVADPSIYKGLLLAGGVGVGKTYLMKLFSVNMRKPYRVANAKVLTSLYERKGAEGVNQYNRAEYSYPEASNLYCRTMGLCIDDIGTEEREKVYMGNRRNVIGDLVEARYSNGDMGYYFHATTNLTPKQLDDHYGARVTSRLRETMNLVELGGPDRRQIKA